jgi:hypothetical protein
MRRRHGRQRLVHAACAVYGLTLWLYPVGFRRRFRGDMVVTFRSQVEAVLEQGAWREWLWFAFHIAWDTVSAASVIRAGGSPPLPASLLGLCEGDIAVGGIERAALDIHLVFAAGGVALALGGWYAYFAVLPAYVR